jgi:hypothetical protein
MFIQIALRQCVRRSQEGLTQAVTTAPAAPK